MLVDITKSHKCPVANAKNWCIGYSCHRFMVGGKCRHGEFIRHSTTKRGTDGSVLVRMTDPTKSKR